MDMLHRVLFGFGPVFILLINGIRIIYLFGIKFYQFLQKYIIRMSYRILLKTRNDIDKNNSCHKRNIDDWLIEQILLISIDISKIFLSLRLFSVISTSLAYCIELIILFRIYEKQYQRSSHQPNIAPLIEII